MTDKWLSYADAAAALGMTPESVRQRARREHWRKQLGNDGKALVLVPADTDRVPAGDTDDDTPASRPVKRPEPDTALAVLQTKLAEAETRISELRHDVERERAERSRERERADHLTDEIANLARQLAQVAQEAGKRETDLREQIAKATEISIQDRSRLASAKAELDAMKARPWWRRLAG
jgi:DNA repair exonuclease SbcCD ATPase subunit